MKPRPTARTTGLNDPLMQTFQSALGLVMPVGSHWTSPAGAVFVWATLAPGWSTRELLDRALAHGMFFVPGQAFLADVSDDSTLRLSISNQTPDTIAEGLIRLAAAIEEVRAPTATQAG